MIFDIQRFCTHDGPGIRTTVFLKGCPLSCAWCHNPESRDPNPELFYSPNLCTSCGQCADSCPKGAHRIENCTHAFDRSKCRLCFTCTHHCFSRVLERTGSEATVEEVLAEVEKDRVFYEESGGGMTLSGGEPTMQFEFTKELLSGARASGISTCLQTCGFAPKDHLLELIPLTDLFLWDIKDTDADRHAAFTGVPLAPILDNLRMVDERGGKTLLRCILIPDINLNKDHLDNLAALFHSLTNCAGIELLAYHRLGASKAERLGIQPVKIFKEPDPEQITAVAEYLKLEWGVQVK